MSAGPGSLAAQAVAAGPQTAAPPSFDGQGWLVALNMGEMTALFLISIVAFGYVLTELRQSIRRGEAWNSPYGVYLRLGILLGFGLMTRTFTSALELWAWNPRDPAGMGFVLFFKRLVDPVSVLSTGSAAILFVAALPGMKKQLLREPIEVDVWQPQPVLYRMAALAASSMIAAILIVSLR